MSMISDGVGSDDVSTSVSTPATAVMTEAAGTVSIQISGEILTDNADMVTDMFSKVTTASIHTVVVDMTSVTSFSLEGVAALVALTVTCADNGWLLHVQPSPAVCGKLARTSLTVVPLTSP